jgi:hypothetical protein
MNGGGRGSRHEYERTDAVECPQGCNNPGGMRRVTHYTGEIQTFEVYGEIVTSERTETYIECPTCGFLLDAQ